MDDFNFPDPLSDREPKASNDDAGVRWWDPVLNTAKGFTDQAASVATSGQYAAEQAGSTSGSKMGRGLSEIFHGASDYLEGNISEGGKRARDAEFVPHDDHASVFSNPVGSIVMKGSGFVAPVSLLMAFPEGALAQAAAGGGMQVGQAIDSAISWTNQLSDQELAQKSPVFRQLVDDYDDPEKARAELHKMQITGKQLLVQAGVGAAGMGQLGRIVSKGAGAGVLKGAATAGAEGAVGMGAAGAAGDYAQQEGQVAAGAQKSHDIDRTLWAGLNSGLEMGGVSAAFGAVHGRAKDPKPAKTGVEIAPEVGDADTAHALAAEAPPAPAPTQEAPAPAAGEPTNAPATQEVTPPKQEANSPSPGDHELQVEPPLQIAAQLEQLAKGEGDRKAVMMPQGTKGDNGKLVAAPKGMRSFTIKKNRFIYDPTKITPKEIEAAVKDGTLNEVLGLGPVTKLEAEARVAQGETPVAVQERNAEGTPVREAVGTADTSPAQKAHFEETGAPGSTVEVTSPEAVLSEREATPSPSATPSADIQPQPVANVNTTKANEPVVIHRPEAIAHAEAPLPTPEVPKNDNTPRVLEDQSAASQAAKAGWDNLIDEGLEYTKAVEKQEAKKAADAEKALAKDNGERVESTPHRSKTELEARAEREKAAEEIFGGHKPDGEENNTTFPKLKPVGLDAVIARLERVIEAAKAQGIALEGTNAKGAPYKLQVTSAVKPHTAYLYVVRDTLAALKKARDEHKLGSAQEIIHKFKSEELMAHAGDFNSMLERRKQEGDQAMRREQTLEGEGPTKDYVEERHELGSGEGEVLSGQHEDEITGRQHDGVDEEHAVETLADHDHEDTRVEGRERQKIENADKLVTAGTDKAGTFQVAKKRAINIPGKKPNVAAVRQAHNLEDGLLSDGKLFTNTGARVQPVNTITVKGIAGHLPEARNILVDKMRRAVFAMLSKKLPDLKIHILRDEDMDRTQGAKTQGYHVIFADKGDGRYLHQTQHIALRMSHFTDGELNQRGMHTLLHEGVHALTSLEIDNNAGFRKAIERIRDEVRHADPSMNDYGLKDAHEFIAEALSNPTFQDALREIKISKELADQFGMQQHSKLTRMWDGLVELVRKNLGLHPSEFTALEAAMRATELGSAAQSVGMKLGRYEFAPKEAFQPLRRPSTDEIKEKALDWKTNRTGALRRAGDKLSSFTMLTQRARKAFGAALPDRLDKLFQAQRVKADKYMEPSTELYRRHAEARRNDKANYDKLSSLAHDAQSVNYDPSQPHKITGDKTADWQLKGRQADLDARYAALPADMKKLYRDTVEHHSDLHTQAAMAAIHDIIRKALGHDDAGLAQRIHDDTATTADHALFKTDRVLKNLNDAAEYKKLRGYFPQMRHGDFVVNGRYEIGAIPQNALIVGDAKDTVRFHGDNESALRRQAEAYAAAHDLDVVQVRKRSVDKNDPTQRVEPQDMNATNAYDVRFQTQHTEFRETESEAKRLADELSKTGVKDTSYTHIREASKRQGLMSHELAQIAKGLQDRDSFKGLNASQKNDVVQALLESTLRMRGGINPSRMHRRNVKGADKDVPRAIAEYGGRMSRHLAREEFKPEVDATLKEMYDHAEANKHDGNRLRRDELLNELDKRINAPEVANSNSMSAKIGNRLLQTTFLGKLGSPAFHFINSMEPHTTTLPILMGRHSIFGAERALLKAYDMVGALSTIKSGLKDTGKAFKHDDGFTDYLADMKTRVKTYPDGKRIAEVLDYLHDHGLFDRDAGMDIERHATPSSNAAGRAIDRMDLMARQLGTAVEANNRAVSGIAAYMLEMKKNGGNHEAALKYAYDVVHDGMGNYAGHNAAPIFNHPIGRLALQFKKFGHKTYYLWGKAAKGMIAGDKEQARIFMGLVATHMLMAGALGLPLEPIKVGLIASNALGVLNYDYNDFEDDVRALAAKVLGNKGGEIFSRGLPRLANVELSSRMGVDGLATFGQPKSGKADDVRSWLFQNLGGAAFNTLIDGMSGVKDMIGGDVMGGAAKVVPLKVAADSLKAAKGYTQGKVSKTGRETMEPLGAGEAALQAFGLKSAREAENGARRGAAGGDQQKFKQERDKLSQNWVLGKGADRAKAMIAINKWNAGQPKDAQITLKDLKASEKRRANEGDNYIGGIRVSKRDRHVVEQKSYYNYK